MKILGLDLGTNSIGWALIKKNGADEGKIIDIGVRIFPMGVNMEKGTKEVSKNKTRRDARQARRQNFRRKIRKRKLAKLFVTLNMFPDIDTVFSKLTGKNQGNQSFRKKFKTVTQEVVLPVEMKSFFSIEPYEARAKAYKGQRLTLFELGRVFYHFAQRRGYKENLQDNDEKGKIYDGKPKEGKTGIDETKQKVEEYGTLGNYLYHENPHKKRLRNRYTLRSMYEDEFNVIWEKQKQYYPQLLTEELRIKIGGSKRRGDKKDGILFFQRPLRSQKHLIGNCTFESSKPRIPKSAIPFEQFRALQFVNSIKDGAEQLSTDDREKAIDIFNSKARAFKFSDIRKKLSNPEGNYNFGNQDKLSGSPTIANFQKIFGAKNWKNLSLKEQEDIWHIKLTADDPKWLEQYAAKKWELNEKSIDRFKSFKLNDDYAKLSRKAIMNILPYLKRGHLYDEAVLLGGLRGAFGSWKWDQMDDEIKRKIETDVIETAINDKAEGKAIDRIKKLLEQKYNLPQKRLPNLYHHSVEREVKIKSRLSEPKNVRNPIVQQALYEVRTIVNAIIDEYGRPNEIRVELGRDLKSSKKHREQMRDRQQEREEENNEIKKRLDEYGKKHTRRNINKVKLWNESDKTCPYTGEQIGFSDLFNEGYVQIEHIIPYSISLNNSLQNKTLCLADKNREKGNQTPFQAFGENGEWETIKGRAYKLFKGNYPKYRRFISKKNPDADDFIERQLNDTRYISKLAKNYLKNICDNVTVTPGRTTSLLRHFLGMDSILGDTYETDDVEDGEYLAAVNAENEIMELIPWNKNKLKADKKKLKTKGSFIQGYVKDDTFYPFKQRDDHRHHAVDALTVACTKRAYLNQIARLSGQGWTHRHIKQQKQIDSPWQGFRTDAEKVIDSILVSHKQTDRVLTNVTKRLYDYKGNPKTDKNGNILFAKGKAARGRLHRETVYGKHLSKDGIKYYHHRKPIDFLKNHKHLAKVVSPRVRRAVEKRLLELGLNTNENREWKLTDLPKEKRNSVFFEMQEKDGKQIKIPKIHLSNKNGGSIPVKKVRVKETISRAERLKEGINQFVDPYDNHHLLVYRNEENSLDFEPITFWETVELKKQKQSILQLPFDGREIISIVQENDMFLLGLTDEEFRDHRNDPHYLKNYLYRVQKISISGYKIVFRHHLASTINDPTQMVGISSFGEGEKGWLTYNPIKVTVSIIGEIALAK